MGNIDRSKLAIVVAASIILIISFGSTSIAKYKKIIHGGVEYFTKTENGQVWFSVDGKKWSTSPETEPGEIERRRRIFEEGKKIVNDYVEGKIQKEDLSKDQWTILQMTGQSDLDKFKKNFEKSKLKAKAKVDTKPKKVPPKKQPPVNNNPPEGIDGNKGNSGGNGSDGSSGGNSSEIDYESIHKGHLDSKRNEPDM